MSRNPFRKARDQQIEIPAVDPSIVAGIFDVHRSDGEAASEPAQPPSTAATTTTKSGKPKKRVVIKTPPRSPEEPRRRVSLGRPASPTTYATAQALDEDDEEDNATAPESKRPQEAVDSTTSHTGDISSRTLDDSVFGPARDGTFSTGQSEASYGGITVTPTATKAPVNPFARTLATTEKRFGSIEDSNEDNSVAKPALDIDTFKDILLNGARVPLKAPRTQEPAVSAKIHQDQTLTTSLDDPILSSEATTQRRERAAALIIEDDDSSDNSQSDDELQDTRVQTSDTSGPETVSFDRLNGPSLDLGSSKDVSEGRGLAEDKPLPALPSPETRPTVPPPPPVPRRQAHSASTEGRRRSSSVMSKSSVQSEASITLAQPAHTNENIRAPPPPPSRRSMPVKMPSATSPDAEAMPDMADRSQTRPPPAPAPRRAPHKAARNELSTTPTSGRSALAALNDHGSGITPPRRPSRRTGESNRSSMDESSLPIRRSSGQDSRRESNELQAPSTAKSQADLLSDLAALQREVDALRAKAGTG